MKRKIRVVAVVGALLSLALAAQEQRKGYTDVKVRVVRATTGKPVRNASVILHKVDEDGKQKKGGMQVKTDAQGSVSVPSVPYGKWRLQVIAPGFQTFGEDYELAEASRELVVKLERPKEQVTIYGEKK